MAKRLYPASASVFVGALEPAQMATFLQQQRIACILDASHPFAKVVSEGAIAATKLPQNVFQTAYLRYERKPLSPETSRNQSALSHVLISTSLDEILNNSKLHHQNILLTLGQRSLRTHASQLIQLRQTSRLFVRILPSPAALSAAIAAGFGSKEIIALRPPISCELEKALWQQWQISLVIAKASGRAGGEDTKRQLAAELGISLWLLERPPVFYPQQTHSVVEALQFCAQQLARYHHTYCF